MPTEQPRVMQRQWRAGLRKIPRREEVRIRMVQHIDTLHGRIMSVENALTPLFQTRNTFSIPSVRVTVPGTTCALAGDHLLSHLT